MFILRVKCPQRKIHTLADYFYLYFWSQISDGHVISPCATC